MHIVIACRSCGTLFDARTHAGLLQCDPCQAAKAFQWPSAGPTVVVLDSGEAWA